MGIDTVSFGPKFSLRKTLLLPPLDSIRG